MSSVLKGMTDTELQIAFRDAIDSHTVKKVLEMIAQHCVVRAHIARADGDRDMQREWQHTAMWINSITGKVTV